jgi:hypothetical protein
MAVGNDPNVEGFVDGIRLAWAVHLMLILDVVAARESVSNASSNDLGYLHSCLEVIFSNNVLQSLLEKVIRTAAYQVYLECHFFPCQIFHFLLSMVTHMHLFMIQLLIIEAPQNPNYFSIHTQTHTTSHRSASKSLLLGVGYTHTHINSTFSSLDCCFSYSPFNF